jgi:DeoR/GlpR family transcriptional regulator of sugar metabolism
MNIDVAVMATSGFSLSGGFTSGYLPEAQLKRKIIAKSALTIMLMDTSKIGRSHPFTFAALEEMDVLILDSQPPRELCDALAQSRVLLFTPGDGHSPEERDRLCRECLRRKRNI